MTRIAHLRWAMVMVMACAVGACATDTDKDKKDKKDKNDNAKPAGVQMVDSGSFGVFVRGQRVVTETFSVQQDNGISLVKAHLQETGSSTTGQKSELQFTSTGELIRYEWSDASGSLVVTPKDEFLLEKITTTASSKPGEQPFLMPKTSAILDNNFFIHREVLAWRYLSADCHQENGGLKCKSPEEFGALVPQVRTSMPVRMELVGREKVTIRGTERELLRLNLKGEAFTWALWLDENDQYKLIRIQIADDNTEVVRD